MKKIFFFCCWSHGLNYLKEIFQELDEKSDLDITFIHFDSINLPNKKISNNYKRIRLVDYVITYGVRSLFKFIKVENPDKILVLDKGSLLMRSVLLISNQLKIPSIHIQEGNIPDLSNDDLLNKKEQKKVLGKFGLLDIFKQIRKAAYVYSIYFFSYLNIPPWRILNINFLKYSFMAFKDPKFHSWFQRSEVKASRAFCYGKSDIEYFTKIDGYEPEEVMAIGKPEFYTVLLKKQNWDLCQSSGEMRERLCNKYSINPEKKIVTLLSQAFLEDSFPGVTKEYKLCHLNELYHVIYSGGFSFVDKLHPRENKEYILDAFINKPDIFFINDFDLDEMIYCSDMVMGYYSTALINAVIFRKHPLIIDWGTGIGGYFFDLQRYKVGTKVSDISELKEKLCLLNNGQLKTFSNNYEVFYDSFININLKSPPVNEIVQSIIA